MGIGRDNVAAGNFSVQPGAVYRVASLDEVSRRVTGGNLLPVYVVDEAEANKRGVISGEPLAVFDGTSISRGIGGSHIAIPVYVSSGTLGSGGSAPVTPPVASTNVNAWNPDQYLHTSIPADFPTYWATAPGMDDDITSTGNRWYPSDVSGESGLLWSGPAFDIASNDMWMEFTVFYNFAAGDHMGFGLRMSNSVETYYGFWCDNANYEIFKVIAGSRTNLDTGSLTAAPTQNDIMRAEVEGTSLKYYLNDVLQGSATDSDISSGYYGIIGDGVASGSVTAICEIRAGSMPYPAKPDRTLYFANQWTFNKGFDLGSIEAIDDNTGANPQHPFDGSSGTSWTDVIDQTHVLEFHFPERIYLNGIMTLAPSTSDIYDWALFDVFGKVDAGDPWTTIGDDLSTDNTGAAGWKSATFQNPMAARYVRIEIAETLNASNLCASSEIVFKSNVPV